MTDLTLTPDWNNGIKESYDFLTEIFTSRSGKEQRRALRQRPRMSISFTALLTLEHLKRFQRDKLTAAGDLVRCGRWSYNQYEGVQTAASVIVIENGANISAGEYCIYRGLEIEYFTVASATDGDAWSSGYSVGFGPIFRILTLSAPLVGDWTAGGTIVPVVEGRIGTQSPFTAITDSVATADVLFDLEPIAAPYSAETFPAIDGVEVLPLRPDWTIAPQHTIEYPYETVDYGIGVIETFAPVDYVNRIFTHTFTFQGREYADKLVGLFGRCKGRRGEFYYPTWMHDLTARTAIVSGSTSIYVDGTDIFDDTVHRAVMVILKDGTQYVAQISTIANPSDSDFGPGEFSDEFGSTFDTGDIISSTRRLVLVDPFPATVMLSQIDRISWMPLCRFASDQLVVSRITDTVSQITANIISLETP